MNFRSDNEAPVNHQIMQALIEANQGFEESYGYDPYTLKLEEQCKALFKCWCETLPLTTGTAANAIAMALSTPAYGAIYCHHDSHLNRDECNAPEFFTHGAKLIGLHGQNGKFTAQDLATALESMGAHAEHECLPTTVSITQATEAGTVHTLDEIRAISHVCKEHELALHMDGARFANALQFLGCSAADMTWKSGVDMVSFGATKNGAMMAEALIVFNAKLNKQIKRLRKRSAHLISKMRYVSAQLLAYLEDDLWLHMASHANKLAQHFYQETHKNIDFLHPVEANEAFCRLPLEKIGQLREQGFGFHIWPGTQDVIRLVFSHATPEDSVENFIRSVLKS
ncbi:threonine aldolase family protein [Marinicella sp. W31]|uniref:threonine aldolase family protein n=1 Tax=Marinicella sp. W31 TaxID=3023713 RepID=UPI003756C1B7